MNILRRIGIGVGIALVAAYLASIGVLYYWQRDFQYEPEGRALALSETLLPNAELVTIPTSEDSTVTGWYQAPQPGKPIILYYKGNADSFSAEHVRYEAFVADGYGFLAFDYRGFPASPGEISQEHILADALAAYDWVKQKNHPIVIWGRSLGSGPATYVASEREADALLLETPFDSAVSVAQERYPVFPVAWLMKDQFPVDQWILKVTEPVFVAIGTADRTIPPQHGQRVYDLAPDKAGIWVVDGAGHSDLWGRGIWARAETFFDEAEGAAGH